MAARLAGLTVNGLRCLDGMSITLDPLTALIGSNGVGKSTTIQALQFLFGQISLNEHDCTDGNGEADVVVTGTFTGFSPDWAARLKPWLNEDGDLVVSRSRTVGPDGRAAEGWAVTRTQAPGFGSVRTAIANGSLVDAIKELWKSASEANGGSLPAWSSKAKALEAMDAFEQANPTAVTDSSLDASVRFGTGGTINLDEMIELLVLPALRDASQDAAESRGSTLARLVDLTVRSGMDLDAELAELSARTSEAYDKILSEAGGDKLNELASSITHQLSSFAPGSQVSLSWEPKVPALSVPPVRARIIESGHEGEVGRQGHGVQRAYVFSLLRALLEARQSHRDARPALLLAVEEPEVYQHPVRARYVARVLAGLAYETDTSTQVLYTTHSPFFVSVDNVASVRLLRLQPGVSLVQNAGRDAAGVPATDDSHAPADEHLPLDGVADEQPTDVAAAPDHVTTADTAIGGGAKPRTRATAPSLRSIASRLDEARQGTGQAWTEERVAAQLPGLLGTSVSEGFFADGVALVEGEEDAGFIYGAADARGIDLAELGIAVIPVGGKDPLPLAHEVFRAVGVPSHVVFDTDVKAGSNSDSGSLRLNSMLTWLVNGEANDQPGTSVTASLTSAHTTLRAVIESELGAANLAKVFTQTIQEMGLSKEAHKNGHLVRVATARVYGQGKASTTLDAVVDRLRAMSPHADLHAS